MECVQKKLNDDEPASNSLQLDGWSAHKHGCIGLLVNYITKDWHKAKLCLACSPFGGSQTGLNEARWLESKCDEWGITEDVGVVTTGTAANMIKMLEYLPIHFLHEPCTGKFPLVSMGGRAEGLACADPGGRTPIGASGII
jgi:hypothetical protein